MTEKERANTTALPLAEKPEVHRGGAESGRSSPISAEQDRDIREGDLPADRFDDERTRELPGRDRTERQRTERGNRGPGEEPGFGQGG